MPLQSVDLHGDEKFVPTEDEVRTIQEKMKDPEFMRLMTEYMESLQDPEYRREEEEYLSQIENEARSQGDYSFDFIFPKEVFYVELLDVGKSKRVFVNICVCDKVEPYREETTGDRMGSNWNVPVSVGREREDKINDQDGPATDHCVVFDAVFNPSTIALAERSDKFQTFLVEIVVENLNGGYGKHYGYQYRRCCNSSSVKKCVGAPANQTIKKVGGDGKLPVNRAPVSTKPHDFTKGVPLDSSHASTEAPRKEAVVPRFTISHRGTVDMTDAWNWKISEKRIGVPKELVVKLDFSFEGNIGSVPSGFKGVKQASWLELEVSTNGTVLEIREDEEGRHPFAGHIVLPFTVESDPVSAKFDRSKSLLTLLLEVIPSQRSDPLLDPALTQVSEVPNPNTNPEPSSIVGAFSEETPSNMMSEAMKKVHEARCEREKQEEASEVDAEYAKSQQVSESQPEKVSSSPVTGSTTVEDRPSEMKSGAVDNTLETHYEQEKSKACAEDTKLSESQPEIVDLRNKQKEWLNAEKLRAEQQERKVQDAINELSKITAEEDEEEQQVQREQAAKAKRALREQQRKELAEKEAERLEAIMREKMAELPLKSALIFEIE